MLAGAGEVASRLPTAPVRTLAGGEQIFKAGGMYLGRIGDWHLTGEACTSISEAVILLADPETGAGRATGIEFQSGVRSVSMRASMRIDKWLWAARFFKTRSLASHACDLGRIQCNGAPVKPSREIRVGDGVRVKNESGDFELEVLELSESRGPAPVAQKLYRETQESIETRQRLAEQRKTMPQFDPLQDGRPSKRDRRRMDQFRGRR